jgi:hypothetical protein
MVVENEGAGAVSDKQVWRGAAVAVLLGALLIRLPLLARPLTASHSDGWRQTDTASIARHFYRNGYQLLYPQVYWGGSGPGYAETEFQIHPFVTALLYRGFGERVWLGRLVSLIFAMAGLWFFHLLARRVAGSRAAVFGLGFLALAPLHLRYSTAFMPEATVFCFYLAALYFFQRWLDENVRRDLWCAGLATATAILVKPTSIQVGLVFLMLLFLRERWRFLARSEIWGFALICVLPGLAWYWHAREIYLAYGNTFGILSGGDSKLGSLRDWLSISFYRSVFKLEREWVFAHGGFLVFLWGAWVCWRRRLSWLPLFGTATAVVYYMAVGRYAQASWGIQYHIFFLPFAALVVGIGLAELSWSANAAAVSAGVALLVMGFNVGQTYLALFERRDEVLSSCGEQLKKLTPPDALVIVSTGAESRHPGGPNNYQEPGLFFFGDRHGWSLPADWHAPQTVERLRQEGAKYFVAYRAPLIQSHPTLQAYLQEHARSVGPGIASGCAIYQLDPLPEPLPSAEARNSAR